VAWYLVPNPSGCTVQCMGLRSLACWDCGFESRRGHECLSVVSVVCFHVEISATGRSLVQRCPTECGVSACDLETSTMRMPRTTRAVEPGIKWSLINHSNAPLWCSAYLFPKV
jgi:hypothetical protein